MHTDDSHTNLGPVGKVDKTYLIETYPGLFDGPNAGEKLTRLVILVALAASAILAIGILALRVGTEGLLAGVAFGAFALVLCVASFANSWDVSCEIGERLDNLRKDLVTARNDAEAARKAPVIREYQGALETAASIRREAWADGIKLASAVERKFWAAMTASAGVTGHGQRRSQERLRFDLEEVISEFVRMRELSEQPPSTRQRQTSDRSTDPAAEHTRQETRAPEFRSNGRHPDHEVPPPATTFEGA